MEQGIHCLGKALLFFYSPVDQIVDVGNAAEIVTTVNKVLVLNKTSWGVR